MNCATTDVGDVLVIEMKIETLDANNAKTIRQEIDPVIHDRSKVAMDMSEIQFIDSSGLGILLTFYRKIKAAEGNLILFGMSSQARSLFELVKMDRIFEILDTQEDAINQLNQL